MKPEEMGRDTHSGDKNVMPSMVVRQQKQLISGGGIGIHQRPASATGCESSHGAESTTSSLLLEAAKRTNQPPSQLQQQQQQQFDQNGLVIPKRVPHHPVFADQPTIRDLNRELKFNQVRGNNVLDKKSELKKALEKLEESKRKKEAEQERLSRRTSLEMRLEERAERIAKETTTSNSSSSSELPRAQSAAAADSIASSPPEACIRPSTINSTNFSLRSLR